MSEKKSNDSWEMLCRRIEQTEHLPVVLFFLVFTIRFGLFFISDEAGGDAIARVAMARNISDHNMWLFAGVWQPLPFYLIAGALTIYNDPNISPRFLSLLYGSFIVFPYYYLVKREFDTLVAVFSLFFLAFYINHIFLSLSSYAESLLIFFIVSTLYFLFSYLYDTSNRRALIYASIILALGCMTRPEAWILIGTLGAVIVINGICNKRSMLSNFYDAVLFSIIPMACISIWFIGNYIILGDLFYFQNWSYDQFKQNYTWFFESWELTLLLVPKTLWLLWSSFWQLGPILSTLITLGVGVALYQRKHLYYIVVPTVLLGFLFYLSLHGQNLMFMRYQLHFSVLFIPFGVFGLVSFLNYFKSLRRVYIVAGILIFHFISIVGVFFAGRYIMQHPKSPMPIWQIGYHEMRYRYKVPDDIKQLVQWTKKTIKTTDKVMLDDAAFATHIIVLADLEDLTQLNGGTQELAGDVNQLYQKSQVYSCKSHDYLTLDQQDREDQIYTYINTYRPQYVFYHGAGYLRTIFKFDPLCQTQNWRSFRFHCEYEIAGYHVYTIAYQDNAL